MATAHFTLLSVTLISYLQALTLCLVTSASTAPGFLESFKLRLETQLSLSDFRLLALTLNSDLELRSDQIRECALMLDASAVIYASTALALLCDEANIAQLQLSTNDKFAGRNRLHPEPGEVAGYLDSVLSAFNWTNISLLYSPNRFGQELATHLKGHHLVTEGLITDNQSSDQIHKTLVREIKRNGSNVLCIATSLAITPHLLSGLRQEKMLKEGYAAVLVGEATWERNWAGGTWQGLLLLKEEDCAEAQTLWECDADRAASLIYATSRQFSTPIGSLTATDFLNYISERQVTTSHFVLVNTQYNSTHKVVGEFDLVSKQLTLVGTVLYPGNLTTIPQVTRGRLEISFNSGLENPTIPPTTSAAAFYLGQHLGVQAVNQRTDLLPHHTLVSNDVAFGATEWKEDWAVPRILASREKLGLAHVTGYASAVVVGCMAAFTRYNVTRPVIGSTNSLVELGNSTTFPLFARNGISIFYFAGLFARILPEIGWMKCAVLYGDDSFGLGLYAAFKTFSQYSHIEIINNATLRQIPSYASKETYRRNYTAHLSELFRCNARIVIIFLLDPAPQYLLELLFDLGARRGDFIITGPWISPYYFTTGSPNNVMKRREVLEGTVGVSPAGYIGDIGKELRRTIEAAYSIEPHVFMCLYYDSVLALAYALDACIQLGLDYEKPAQLMKVLRETRFHGCSGFVSWLSGSNDRTYVDYSFASVVRDPVSGNFSFKTVGLYSPTSLLLFNFTDSFTFADGGSVPPPDLRITHGKCPFEEKLVKSFPPGENVMIGVCMGIVGITMVFSAVLFTKVRKSRLLPIKRREISVNDVVFMGTIGLEAVQLAAIGPDFKSLNGLVTRLARTLVMDIDDIISFNNGVYWLALNVAFGCVLAWGVLLIFAYLKAAKQCKDWCVCEFMAEIADTSLPLLGNVCFLPLLFVLIDVYACDHVVGYGHLSYTDSILARDCYVHCWGEVHILYVVFASLALVCYLPSAMLLRPVWQSLQGSLHIQTRPSFLLLKSCVQVCLVCLSKTVKRWHPFIYSVLFLGILVVYFAVSSRVKAYNYSRVNLWLALSLVGVFELALTAFLNDTLQPQAAWVLVAAVAVLWFLCLVFGLVLQSLRLPSMLYRKKGRDFGKILRFAFTNKVPAAEIQPQLNLLRTSEVDIVLDSEESISLPQSVRRIPVPGLQTS